MGGGGGGWRAGRSRGFKEALGLGDRPPGQRPEATGVGASRGRRPALHYPGLQNRELSASRDEEWTLGSTLTLPPVPREPRDLVVPEGTARGKVSVPFWRFLSRPPEVPRLEPLAAGDRLGVGGAERLRMTPTRPPRLRVAPSGRKGLGEGGARRERREGEAEFHSLKRNVSKTY